MADFRDPYFDYKNNILRNLVGATSREELDKIEADLVAAKTLGLATAHIARTNDLTELCAIHEFLFNEIYDFAGKIRTVDIRKNEDDSEYFLIVSRILPAADFVFSELRESDYLQNMKQADFVKKLAYFYDQLNYIHPFREGNGRVQREFWQRVASDARYFLDWTKTSPEENNTASRIAAETQNRQPLEEMFKKIVDKKEEE